MLDRPGKSARPWRDWLVQFGLALLAVGLALLAGAVVIVLTGASPAAAYRAILYGAFGNINNLSETAVKAVPLILAGAGLAIAYRANMWNIGAEGQIFVGGMCAVVVGLYLGFLPAAIVLPLAAVAAFVGGALWAGIAGVLKVRLGIDEVINTIMLNYIAVLGVNWLIHGPLMDPKASFPRTAMLPANAQLPILIPRTRLHAGVLLAVALAVILQWALWRTSFGYRIRAVGMNKIASRYGGINVGRTMLQAMLISGGMAGLAGMTQTNGLHFRMLQDISGGIGFTAIAVALLAGNHPIATLLSGFVLAALDVGANAMQIRAHAPLEVVRIIQGLVIIFVVGCQYFNRRILAQRRSVAERQEHEEKQRAEASGQAAVAGGR
jgi:general nucleoside transport system permease protein